MRYLTLIILSVFCSIGFSKIRSTDVKVDGKIRTLLARDGSESAGGNECHRA